MEGPFISTKQSGCHPVKNIISDLLPNPSETVNKTYGEVLEPSIVALVSFIFKTSFL